MKISRIILVALIALFSVLLSAQDKIVIDGSTTVGPIAKAFAEYYMQLNPKVNITVSESGSGNGAKSLMNKTCDIGTLSRFMKDKEFSAAVDNGIMPVAHVVALDGIAVVINPANSVKNLSVEQIKDIYTGKVTNWKEVGGPNEKIVVISRDTNSGTYETFESLVMKKEKMNDKVEYVGSNGAARQRVQSTKGAIGYIGLGFLDKTVKAVNVNNIEASPETVVSGKYPIARPLYMFTNQYPKMGSHLYSYITLYLSPKGQEIIESIGFIPVTKY
ncbi:MAG: PstS family phosphate ABC transporter substrate-binding protein [Candidatus Cloacimonetes bacterium]|nr:PstS family phosphate ABC transporter substrate-binding protein [Candidatus Cloacimonadota bacterium]